MPHIQAKEIRIIAFSDNFKGGDALEMLVHGLEAGNNEGIMTLISLWTVIRNAGDLEASQLCQSIADCPIIAFKSLLPMTSQTVSSFSSSSLSAAT